MSKKNACVLLYLNYQGARQAVEKLQTRNFNMKTVSIIGKGDASLQPHFGKPVNDEPVHFQNIPARWRQSLWNIPGGALFFTLADFGSLVTAGSIVTLLMQEINNMDINNGFTVLATALFNMGIPRESIKQYEKSVQTEKILLTVNGERSDVEQACQILHNEKQQATVHIA